MNSILKQIEKACGRKASLVRGFAAGNYGRTYEIMLEDESLIAKLVPAGDENRIGEILSLQRFLAEKGAPVPSPVPLTDGSLYCKVSDEVKTEILYLMEKKDGVNAETLIDELVRQKSMQLLGRQIAGFHKALRLYDHSKMTILKHWSESDNLFVAANEKNPQIEAEIYMQYNKLKEGLSACEQGGMQIIHCDLHFDNILYDRERKRFSIIDLEDFCLAPVVMDLAVIVFDLPVILEGKNCGENIGEVIGEILAGYQSAGSIDQGRLSSFADYLKLLELAIYINFYEYKDSGDGWLSKFYKGRKKKILERRAYIDYDFQAGPN